MGTLATLRIMRDPYAAYQSYCERYGELWRVDAVNGRVWITHDPARVREMFAAQPDTFAPFGIDAARPLLGDHSLLLMSGPEHRRERKLLKPAFHGDRIAGYGERIRGLARESVAPLTTGDQVSSLELGMDVALDVILSIVFGADDQATRRRVREIIEKTATAVKPWMLFAPPLRRVPGARGAWERFVDARAAARTALLERVDAARATPSGDTVLHELLAARDDDGVGLQDDEIVDELITLLFAGHETTAVTIGWTMEHLHRNPESLEQLRDELAQHAGAPAAQVSRLPWLDACCREALRVTPILADVIRKIVRPFTWAGQPIPVGENIAVAVREVHRRPDLYPEPDRFNPQRFIDRRYRPWEYLPFGGGNRRCIGAALAEMEVRLTVAELVGTRRFRPVHAAPERPARRNITIAPEHGGALEVVG